MTIFCAIAMWGRMLIYKIFRAAEWDDLQANGETLGAPIDIADGYIHLSSADTVKETVEKYFAGATGLVICAVEADGNQLIEWEPARNDVLFPHLYRKMRMDDVVWSKPLPLVDGVHVFPDL